MLFSGCKTRKEDYCFRYSPVNQAKLCSFNESQLKGIESPEIPLDALIFLDAVNTIVTRNDCFYLQMFWNLWLFFLNNDQSSKSYTLYFLAYWSNWCWAKRSLASILYLHIYTWNGLRAANILVCYWLPAGLGWNYKCQVLFYTHSTAPTAGLKLWLGAINQRIKGWESEKSLHLEFHFLEFQPARSLMSKAFTSLLSIIGKHQFSLVLITGLTVCTGFHKESSRLLQGFDTYGCAHPNVSTTPVLPKIECPWQCNSFKSKFGRNDKW